MRMRTLGKALVLAMTVSGVAASILAAQQPSRGIRNVALNVVALDSHGNPVDDLTVADFQVSDQGKQQRIVSFARSADLKQLSVPSKPGARGAIQVRRRVHS